MSVLVKVCQGFTSAEGATNVYIVNGGPGNARRITEVFANLQEHAFYIADKRDFELIWGRFSTIDNTITVVNLFHSSNADAPVVWRPGQKIVSAVQLPPTALGHALLSANTPSEAIDALELAAHFPEFDGEDAAMASPLDGTEKLFGLQGGLFKAIEPRQIGSTSIIQAQGYDRTTSQSFTALTHTPPLFSGVNQGMFGAEPILCHLGNGGTVTQPSALLWPLRRGLALLSMTANNASYAGITSTNYPFYPAPSSSDFYFGAVLGLTALPSGPTAQQQFIIGITPAPGNVLPAQGLYFLGSTASSNWRAFSTGPAESITDTGFAMAAVNGFTPQLTTFEIMSNADEDTVRFYIDAQLVASPLKSLYYPNVAAIFAGAYCFQGGHTTPNSMIVDAMYTSFAVPAPGSLYGLGTGML